MQASSVLEPGAAIARSDGPTLNLKNLLSDELLTAFHPLVKLPLLDWVQNLLAQLAALDHTNPDYGLTSACFNQAALIEFHFGNTERAFELCYAHLEWLAKLISGTGRLELAGQSFDPWLNLGRLERLIGRHEAALQKFELLAKALDQPETRLGPLTLTQSHWEAIKLARLETQSTVTRACLTDTLKTLLKAKKYQATLQFVEGWLASAPSPILQNILIEAKFVALARLGQHAEALELIEARNAGSELKTVYISKTADLLNFAFALRQTEALALAGELAAARKLAKGVALIAQFFRYDKESQLFKIALALRTAKLLEALALPELATPVAQNGYAAALAVQDEIWQAEFLKLLLTLEEETGKTREESSKWKWQQAAEQLALTTCYKGLGAKLVSDSTLAQNTNSYPIACSVLLDKLYTELIKQVMLLSL